MNTVRLAIINVAIDYQAVYSDDWKKYVNSFRDKINHTPQVKWARENRIVFAITEYVNTHELTISLAAVATLTDMQCTDFYLRF